MILKILTHDRGNSDVWNWYDGVTSASAYYDDNAKLPVVAVRFKDADVDVVIALTEEAYLCNDEGRTIDRLL